MNDKEKTAAMMKSVSAALEVNMKHDQAIAATIQRRGMNYPGDVGNNFGLNDFRDPYSNFNIFGDYRSSEPGISMLGANYGYESMLGYGGGFTAYGQGSYAAFRRNTKVAQYKMGMCVSAYKGFGLAKNVIDLMANFASEGLKIKHKNKTIERFLNRWAFMVDLQNRVKDILRYYYKYGNVFIYSTPGLIEEAAYNRMRRSTAKDEMFKTMDGFGPAYADTDPLSDPMQSEREKRAEDQVDKPLGKREIPWRYTLLNPFQMELRGSKFFGKHRWVFILDHTTASEISNGVNSKVDKYVDFLDESKINLPIEFMNLSGQTSKDTPSNEGVDARVVAINQERLYTMHYMKDDHEDWADPMLWPVMSDIFYKNKLRQMDISVCNSVINAITLFKIGNLKEGYIPDESTFDKFAEYLRSPTQAMQMVWNDAISIENSFPPVDKILGMAKYESVDADILRGIGIPEILIGGTGANYSSGFLGVRTLLERLEEGRETVERWLLKELENICRTLGIRNMPTVKFGKMSLRDEQKEKQLIIQLLDRNVISIEAVLEAFGEDFNIELERMRDENKIREEEGLLKKHSPYPDPITDMDEEEKMRLDSTLRAKERQAQDKQKQKEIKNAQDRNGRPPGTDGIPHAVQRETKPKGMADFAQYEKCRAISATHVESVKDILTRRMIDVLGKSNARALTNEEVDSIVMMTLSVATQLSPKEKVTAEAVLSTLEKHPTIDKVSLDIYNEANYNGTMASKLGAITSAVVVKLMENQYADR